MTPPGESFLVVTPNLNMGRYLPATIESVLRNLRAGDEYAVIDGGSTDDSLDVLHAYGDRISWWVSEQDGGYGEAIAKGLARGRAELQCWVNAGDLLLEGALDAARAHIAHTGADFIFGDDFHIDDTGRVLAFSRGYVPSLRDYMLFGGWTPLQDACFWRRRLYERVGGIDTSMKFACDYDLFLRFSLRGRCVYVPVAFSAFRQHAGQKSIARASDYERERQQCRQRALSAVRVAPVRRLWLEAWLSLQVRYRGHVLNPSWNLPDLVGTPITSLSSRAYG